MSSGIPIGAIVGMVLGIIAGALIVAFLLWKYCRSNKVDLAKLPEDVRWQYSQYYDSPGGNYDRWMRREEEERRIFNWEECLEDASGSRTYIFQDGPKKEPERTNFIRNCSNQIRRGTKGCSPCGMVSLAGRICLSP
jgi:hypothetical protein